jgi:predicted flap endonuclease-1-like 5' DNA nuclease
MWEEFFRRWVNFMFWWWPRSHEGQPRGPETTEPATQEESPRPSSEEAGKQAVASRHETVPDDLTVIKGIGPATQERLRSLGIRTFEDLATATPDDLAARLKSGQPVAKSQVRRWVDAARKASTRGA